MSFEKELDRLFADAIDIKDSVWYTNTETLRDATIRIYNDTM